MNKKPKPYNKMTLSELRKATKEFDHETPWEETRPLMPSQRREFEASQRAARRRRARKGVVAKRVTVDLDEDLIAKSNEYAVRHQMTLSDVIELSLRNAFLFVE